MPVLEATLATQWQMPSGECRNLYKIAVYRKPDEIKRVMELLFKHGYVFTQNRRIRDYPSVERLYLTGVNEWEYFKFGFDEDCKAVFGHIPHWESHPLKNRYQTVTIDEFLYEIMGHKKPEPSQIVTVEQFNKEFEEFQRQEYPATSPIPMLVINDGEDNEPMSYAQTAEIFERLRTRAANEVITSFVGEQQSSIDHIVASIDNYSQISVADLANYRTRVDAGRIEYTQQYTQMLERQLAEVDRQNDESIRQAIEGTPSTVEGGSTTPSREARQRPLRTLTQRRNARRAARRAARAQTANE